MISIYGDINSGNCYKVKLLATQLGLQYTWRHVDILAGETRTAAFLAKNPNGKIPLLEMPDGFILAESNAILCYLAYGTPLLPQEPKANALVMQWLFFEQYSHEPTIAVARFIMRYLHSPLEMEAQLRQKQAGGMKALAVMEQQLTKTPYIAGTLYSIADIALYAYTHVADEGGFDLAPFPAICAWLARIAAQPNHASMHEIANALG
jgi:glutathione S-transferase